MDELSARFDLLKLELSELQQAIRAADTILFQVKGLAVTVALGSAGIGLTTDRPLAAGLGVISTAAFALIDAHRKVVQRRLSARSIEIEMAVASNKLSDILAPESSLHVPGMATHLTRSYPRRLRRLRDVLAQVARLQTSTLYVALLALSVLAIYLT
ncbi:hypothetical protein OG474_29350 [Kribbella sp. NBC_01505]|uniref:hypothetical protein n=1 Tax=Kribbella sp. NBC_01505 TaxID=2903580 RepID=UPI00386F55AB